MEADIEGIFEQIIEESTDTKQQGSRYERAVKFFLENDPAWSSRLEMVWLWKDAPTNDGSKRDLGIDLVALDYDGSYWAVQAKCYSKKRLYEGDVTTFIGTAGLDSRYDHLMIADSVQEWSQNLLKVVHNEHNSKDVVRVSIDDIKAANLGWNAFVHGVKPDRRKVHEPLPHQGKAIEGVKKTLNDHDRCSVFMACGTGKTLMALRAAEELCPGGTVLFLAPSISLVSQSMRAWSNEVREKINPYVICSDSTASDLGADVESYGSLLDVPFPATTNPKTVVNRFHKIHEGLNVIFSTYQSIDKVHEAQQLGLPDFDLAICDEAHRTTGVLDGETSFRMIHDSDYIHAAKRMYMTATPRIFGEDAKKKAKSASVQVASMDDVKTYGPVAYRLSFGKAVSDGLLTDYKVVVMKISESMISTTMQRLAARDDMSLEMPDVAKFIGCWKALFDRRHGDGYLDPSQIYNAIKGTGENNRTLHHAIAFAASIRASKALSTEFQTVVDAYLETIADEAKDGEIADIQQLIDQGRKVTVGVQHVDGTMDSGVRKEKLDWLAAKEDEDTCHILSNARCLAEGVDVPALDAVIYLSSRKSKVDIIQSVGRVMRKADGKQFGYIIIPVFVPAGTDEAAALSSSKDYKVVWDVVRALRSHDERLDAVINAGNFGDDSELEKIVEVEVLDESKLKKAKKDTGGKKHKIGEREGKPGIEEEELGLDFSVDVSDLRGLGRAIRAQIVKKCGNKIYWTEWTGRVAKITQMRTKQIADLVKQNEAVGKRFETFLKGLRESLNDDFTDKQAIEVLAQHEVTRPVFCALFDNEEVVANNPITRGLDRALASLYEAGLPSSEDDRELAEVYASVRDQVRALTTDASRQRLVKEIYNEFFKVVFKDTADSLGIVYTPVEVVDAQLHMVQRVMEREFGMKLGDKGVHILDGFAGTGTYMCRLIEDETLISDDDLEYKFLHDLHSNEIVPLAASIMDINIEQSYHSRKSGDYVSFPGALLTDTFQMHESSNSLDTQVFTENSERIAEQIKTPITVCVGNPPYNVAKTTLYSGLKEQIEKTYALESSATLKNNLYNSYFLAYRWATDRIGESGIVAFVSGAGWLKGNAGDGVRRSFRKEFNSIYIVDLRGNKEFRRLSKLQLAEEGDNIFGSGSKSPIAITILVKNPNSTEHGVVRYFDLGKKLSYEEKCARLRLLVHGDPSWTVLNPNEYEDWLDLRDDSFERFIPCGMQDGTKKLDSGLFNIWSQGVKTNRDEWCYNFKRSAVANNMRLTVKTYLSELDRWKNSGMPKDVKAFLTNDSSRIKWTRELYNDISRSKGAAFSFQAIRQSLYRPFCKQWLYMDSQFNNCVYQQPKLFPFDGAENLEICVTGPGNNGFSCMITDLVPCLDMQQKSQCFPLYWYSSKEVEVRVPQVSGQASLFGGDQLGLFDDKVEKRVEWVRHDAINDEALEVFRTAYPDVEISKEDIFYYVYGIFHSPEYRERYGNNLQKELPRIPLAHDFNAFMRAGRELKVFHVDYEALTPWSGITEEGDSENPSKTVKMAWGRIIDPDTGNKVKDYSTLKVAENLELHNIPVEAQRYVVNGKSALEWIVDRYQIKEYDKSGIVNDPNTYSTKGNGQPDKRYIVDLVKKVTTVSMRTLEIIDSLPPLNELAQPDCWPSVWK